MTAETTPSLPVRSTDAEFEVKQLAQWVDAYGERETWPAEVRHAYVTAVARHREAFRAGDNWLEAPTAPTGGAQ